MKIRVLNSGSSSQRSCLYEIGDSIPDDHSVGIAVKSLAARGASRPSHIGLKPSGVNDFPAATVRQTNCNLD
jgi:hypothetical protein